MELALNVAGALILTAIAAGAVMLVVLIWGLIGERIPHLPPPEMHRLPTAALDETQAALERLRGNAARAAGAERDRLAFEERRLAGRLRQVETQTFDDQFAYYETARRLERAWAQWKALRDDLAERGRGRHTALRRLLAEAEQQVRALRRKVEEEYHRTAALDVILLQELKAQGVLTPELSRPIFAVESAPVARHAPPPAQGAEPPPEPEPPAPRKPAPQQPPKPPPPEAPRHPEPPSAQAEESPPLPGAAPAGPVPVEPIAATGPAGPPLPPFALVTEGTLHQQDFDYLELPKVGRRYADPAFAIPAGQHDGLHRLDLSRVSFAQVRFSGVHHYEDCAFIGADFRRMVLPQAAHPHRFVRCDFTGATFGEASLAYTLFDACTLSQTHWGGAHLDRIKFVGCTLEGVRWEGVDLGRTLMSPDMLARADFTLASRPPFNAPSPQPIAASGSPRAPTPGGAATGSAPGAVQPVAPPAESVPPAQATPPPRSGAATSAPAPAAGAPPAPPAPGEPE